jgi:isoleucyl-tRNA synthetase
MGPYLENKKEWENWFPADLISENMPGQYRGWFNALFWSSVTLTGKAPFKAVFGYETLKDENGAEMHKSKGNAIWFDEAVEKIGADTMRLLYSLQDPARELRFGYNVVKEPRQDINILYNLSNLIESKESSSELKLEDKWIVSRLNSLVKEFTEELELMHPHLATRALRNFWLNDLSRGYIQFVRERMSKGDEAVGSTLGTVYLELLKLCAPVIPFVTEEIYQNLKSDFGLKEESIHLHSWPNHDKSKIDESLERDFDAASSLIQGIFAAREKANVGVRWPLPGLTVVTKEKGIKRAIKNMEDLIKSQTNVKQISFEDKIKDGGVEITVNKSAVGMAFKSDAPKILSKLDDKILQKIAEEGKCKVEGFELTKEHVNIKENLPEGVTGTEFKGGAVYLDTTITPELEAEGFAREVTRRVQEMRKKEGLKKSDSIELSIVSKYDISAWEDEIKAKVGASALFWEDKKFKVKSEEKIKGKIFALSFKTH